MDYRVLGKLEALRDGEAADLGAFRQRALLALLLTSPNSVFSTDQLIDGLWGDDGSPDRQNSLWVYVSGLRKALEPDREKRSDGTILLTRAPGYVLHTEADEVDAVRFERLVVEGKALAHTDPGAASVVLGEALSMWRGRPYEDFTYESFAQAEIARLDGLRLEAVEARIDADLDRGLSRELVPELETLVRQHPLQEHLTGQLMRAFYRSGRQADALRSYQALRSRLGEELGLEPGKAIQRLEAQIVTGDETLDVGFAGYDRGSGKTSGMAVRGYELRDEIREDDWGVTYRAYQPAVGREVAISVIRPELANDPEFIRNFEADAQLVASLEHPHIVPLHDFWREPDAAYVVTRLMSGGTLADTLEQRGLTAEQATVVVDQVGAAAALAQRSSVALPALTPSNIVLDDEGNAYVSNMGLVPFGASASRTYVDVISELGLVAAQAISGLTGEMAQVRGALAAPLRDVLDRATTFGGAPGFPDIDTFAAELRTTVGLTESVAGSGEDLVNPYKGLRSFEPSDESVFFGRERLIDRLVARLGESGVHGRFVTLVGPSGSGKSSVVKAGLLPALRNGALPLSDSWFTVSMTPAPHPFEELEDALRTIAVDPPSSLVDLLSLENGLHRAVERVMPQDASQLLLVIDQFEELFTQVDRNTATQFLDVLAAAVNHDQSRLRVVITLRADFYDRPLRHRGVGELLRLGTEAITPMTPEELERAIAGPAEAVGVTVEPTLIAGLVTDVVDRAGALPLLQYALTELFDGRSGRRMTIEIYREIGGMSGALVDRAEGLLARLGEHAHDATRQLFLRLVTLGEGTDDTRRRVLRSELEQLSIDREILAGVLDTFGRHRLLSFDRDPVTRSPTVEISHEALLTEWGRLRDWIDGARQDVRNQRRLAEAMGEWAAAGRTDEYLLRGGRLDQLGGWADTTSLPLSAPEQGFLDASLSERDRLEEETAEREQRAAAAEQRASKRARQLVGAGVLGVLVAGLALFGVVQWRTAESAKSDVDALLTVSEWVTASEMALSNDDPDLALLYAMQAIRDTVDLGFADEDAIDAVHWSLQAKGVQYDVDQETPVAVRSGPDGLAGVFAVSPAILMDHASNAIDRTLTDDECATVIADGCPGVVPIPEDLAIRGGVDAYGVSEMGDGVLAGTTVSVAAASLRAEPGLERQLEAFSEQTGIEIELVSNTGEGMLALQSGEFDIPDIIALGNIIPDWALDRVLDLTPFLDLAQLQDDFGAEALSMTSLGENPIDFSGSDTARGVPIDADLKGLVYYPKTAFAEAGYATPRTWDELMELSAELVAAGETPWCVAFESGFPFNGWPGTDLLEALVLRTGGEDVYTAWSAGEVRFGDAPIVQAAELADSMLFEPGFVRLGPEAISNQNFTEQMFNLLRSDRVTGEVDPACWMYFQGDFMLGMLPPGTVVGQDVDYFQLPPLELGEAPPVIGSITTMSGVVDRPEVRLFLEYVASPEWGTVWAAEPGNGFISLNANFDVAAFERADDPSADLRRRLSADTTTALQTDRFRRDASDNMPQQIGGWSDDPPEQGAFYSGMTDWVDGVSPIEQVLADIDAAWDELRSTSGS